jgi:hypothetical protein
MLTVLMMTSTRENASFTCCKYIIDTVMDILISERECRGLSGSYTQPKLETSDLIYGHCTSATMGL